MLKRLSAYFCYWELMFPPCGTPNLLPAFIKYSVFGFAFQACVWQVFMCACVALRFQWPYSSSAWSLIQVEARDCVTFPPQVTERAEGPEGRERRRLTKWKKKKRKKKHYLWQMVAFLASLPQTYSLLLLLSSILISVFSNRTHYPPQEREEEERG